MVRVDHYSHLDDPHSYFRRLESYASSRTKSNSRFGSDANSYANHRTRSLSPARSTSIVDSQPVSELSDSRVSGPPSRPHSYASSRPRSYANSDRIILDPEKSALGQKQYRSYSEYTPASNPRSWWTRKRKIVLAIWIALLAIIAIIAGVVAHVRASAFHYTPSYAQVTNPKAFASGGATHQNPNVTSDGIGPGRDVYTYYSGGPEHFPAAAHWVSFDDMWQANLPAIQNACSVLGYGSNDSPSDTQDIYNAIQNRANASLVDHRFILAVIMQESHGCVHVPSTSSNSGVQNPGLMQSHNGHSYSAAHASLSILAMIQDGTQGTSEGDGLVQNLNIYGNPYSAARGYNSGVIAADGNLSNGVGATSCYVSDVANRLTGWVNAKSTCPGDEAY